MRFLCFEILKEYNSEIIYFIIIIENHLMNFKSIFIYENLNSEQELQQRLEFLKFKI